MKKFILLALLMFPAVVYSHEYEYTAKSLTNEAATVEVTVVLTQPAPEQLVRHSIHEGASQHSIANRVLMSNAIATELAKRYINASTITLGFGGVKTVATIEHTIVKSTSVEVTQ